jgi:hypothetical protein
MTRRPSTLPFMAANILMWLLMMVVLVVVPDTLERWTSIEIARVVGWALASGLWVVALQAAWRRRVGPFVLFVLQLGLWVSAAIVAIWISDLFRF